MFSLSGWGDDSILPSRSPDAATSNSSTDMCHRPTTTAAHHDCPRSADSATDLESGGSSATSLCAESDIESARPYTEMKGVNRRRRRTCDGDAAPIIREDENVTFRPLQESDREEIQRLHEDWFPVDYKEDFYDGVVQNKMASTGQPLYTQVAVVSCPETQQERIIGCIVGSFVQVAKCKGKSVELMVPNPQRHTRMFYIMTLGTVKEFRGRGLATTLLEQCFDIIEADMECGVSYLHVITYNTAAIQFYEKLEFSRVEEIENYYLIDGQKYNCYLYAKYHHGNRGHFSMYRILRGLISYAFRSISSRVHYALGYGEYSVPYIQSDR